MKTRLNLVLVLLAAALEGVAPAATLGPYEGQAAGPPQEKIDQLVFSRLEQLRIPPANHLEKLVGQRAGQYSIRINDQWRICFEWPEGSPGPLNVEILDYH